MPVDLEYDPVPPNSENPEAAVNTIFAKFKAAMLELQAAIGTGGGSGLPPGGLTGQFLAKISNEDGDADWVDPPEGGGGETGPATEFYKMKVLATRGTSGAGFAEIEFRSAYQGAATSITAASTSLALGSFPLSNAYDGNNNTFHTNGQVSSAGYGQEYSFTLSAPIELKQVYILPRQDGFSQEVPTSIELFSSPDGASYTSLGVLSPTVASVGAEALLFNL